MRHDRRAQLSKVAVVVGVVEVPVRVDERLDRRFAQRIERLLQLVPGRLHERVDDDLAVRAVRHDDVAAGPGEHRQVSVSLRLSIGAAPICARIAAS